jgi:hypothetical protein
MKQLTFVAERGAAVTPSDTETFGPSLIYVGGAGTITIRDVKGSAVLFTAVAGGVLPVLATGVNSTGTLATLIVRGF